MPSRIDVSRAWGGMQDQQPDYERDRDLMIAEQLICEGRDIHSPEVLNAMRRLPRHEFVLEDQRHEAYDDHPLPIGYGQTISQPFIVAYMTEKLGLKQTDRVLEIGTGCGYQTAILSLLASEVYTIEIIDELAQRAQDTCRRLGYLNIHFRTGDGADGWPEHAPFDAILAGCSPEAIPESLIQQLADGGRMILPVGPCHRQALYRLTKCKGEMNQRRDIGVNFVLMTGKAGQKC